MIIYKFALYTLLLSYNPCDVFTYYNVTEMHGLNLKDCQAYNNTSQDAYFAGWSNCRLAGGANHAGYRVRAHCRYSLRHRRGAYRRVVVAPTRHTPRQRYYRRGHCSDDRRTGAAAYPSTRL